MDSKFLRQNKKNIANNDSSFPSFDLEPFIHCLPAAPTCILTLQTVGVEQVLALFVALDAALRTSHPLSRQAPQQPLALETVGRRGGRPHVEVVGRRA